ncbi:unnamed protein product [Alopecurus aequalis]
MSSSSASVSHSKWPRFGPVPLGRCPDCPRTASLTRQVTKSDKNGNRGREFVKCESKEQLGEDLLPCDHFEWIEDYIKRIQKEDKSLVPNLPPAVEQLGSAIGIVATVNNGVQKDELKKMAKQLEKLVDLKKQSNLLAAIFYLCAIVLGVVYLLIISQK